MYSWHSTICSTEAIIKIFEMSEHYRLTSEHALQFVSLAEFL